MSKIDNERLAGAIKNLSEEVRTLRDSIDEFRTAIRWGIENDKFQAQQPQTDTKPNRSRRSRDEP